MRRLLFILVTFLVGLSVTAGTVAHAMEPFVCLDATTAASMGHSNGDGDQSPSESDKGVVHHHGGGCHGHHVGDTVSEVSLDHTDDESALSLGTITQFPAATLVDPALRPPIA